MLQPIHRSRSAARSCQVPRSSSSPHDPELPNKLGTRHSFARHVSGTSDRSSDLQETSTNVGVTAGTKYCAAGYHRFVVDCVLRNTSYWVCECLGDAISTRCRMPLCLHWHAAKASIVNGEDERMAASVGLAPPSPGLPLKRHFDATSSLLTNGRSCQASNM
jgi:hypothetical protein